jgi:hypothetical protein
MPMPSFSLDCPSGHPVKKFKRLKPWQGRIQRMRCGICTIEIHRDTFRWRCQEHCEYNICEDCYNEHWLNVIAQAANTDSQKRRFRILDTIPEHLRDTPDYEAALNYAPPEEPSPRQTNGHGKTKKVKGIKTPRVDYSDSRCVDNCPSWCSNLQVCIWVLTWLAASVALAVAVRALLLDKALEFPSTLLMMGLSNAISYVLCQFAVICSHCCIRVGYDADWKASGVFGLMRCLQVALSYSAMNSSETYHNLLVLSYTVLLFFAGVLNKSEQFGFVALISLLLAMSGGLLAVSAQGTFSTPLTSNVLGFQVVSLFAGTIRMIMTQNYLSVEDPSGRSPKVSPLVLATRMTPTIALASFELACITNYDCFAQFMRSPDMAEIIGFLVAIGFANAVALVAELQLLQLTSATLLGLLWPCSSICIACLVELREGNSMPPLLSIGALLYTAGFVLYVSLQVCCASQGEHDNGYQRLEGGERRHRRHRRSEGRSRDPDGTRSPRSPRRPQRGAGVTFDDGDWI